MLQTLLLFADKYNMLPDTGLVLVCISGGADSMCLLDALLALSPQRGFTVGAAHFNHKLRGAESERDEEFVKRYCEKRGVAFYGGSGDVGSFAREQKLSIEDAARQKRYAFFHETAALTGAVRIATAHTADDNAETVIMNLTRGAGASGLMGIPPVRGMIIRPMLEISRSEVMRYVDAHSIPYVEDSTNALDIYTRNRIRREVIPALKKVNPRFTNAVSSLSELLRADEEYLSSLADKFIDEHCDNNAADAVRLAALHQAIAGRVVRKLYGGNLSHEHVKAVLALCGAENPSASLSLPGMAVYREYGRLVFGGDDLPRGFEPVFPSTHEPVIIPELGLKITCKIVECDDRINKSLTCFLFKSVDICGRITVRSRLEGDSIKLNSQSGTKTLKKLFIERRIPARDRPLVPVIADERGALAVYGLGVGIRAAPSPYDTAIEIKFEEGSGL